MLTKGLGIAAKGMMALIDQQDTTANNLANVNTVGFKKANLVFQNVFDAQIFENIPPNEFKYADEKYVGELAMGPKTQKVLLDFSQGNLERTGNPLDVAVEGDGFFKIQSVEGDIAYTRNGSFVMNNEKMLVTKEGEYVLDNQNKPIQLDMNRLNIENVNDLVINEDGQIIANSPENQVTLQKIGIFDFRIKTDLRSIGDSKFVPNNIEENPEIVAEIFSLQQGALEGANSNTVNEMINIINTTRSYETLSKFVKNDSELLSRAINLGRVSQVS